MGITLPEHDHKDSEGRTAASEARTGYRWYTKMDLWVSHFHDAFVAYRTMKHAFRKSQYRGLPFSYHSRLFRALRCYLAVLDDVAGPAWEHTTNLPASERRWGFHGTYACEHTRRVDPEFRKRGLIWKDADRDLLIAVYQTFRVVGDKPSDPTPNEWSRVPGSIRLSRSQTDRCKNTISNQTVVGETWVSKHFDLYHFDACVFRDCDFSNASFASSVFTRCTFLNVLMVNARLTGAAFAECEFAGVDFGGAMLENVRLWYRNRFSGIRIDPFTRIVFPLLEECELSYELAARNYGLLKSWYSDADLRSRRSDCSFREQYCLSQSYPYGRDRLKLFVYRLLSGYNERPFRFALWLVAMVIGLAAVYQKVGLSKVGGKLTFLDALYFSVVTFTTLGYGDIAPTNNSFGQAIVIVEVILGVIGIAYLTALVIRRLL